MGETERLAVLSIQEEIKRDRARERELREGRREREREVSNAIRSQGRN